MQISVQREYGVRIAQSLATVIIRVGVITSQERVNVNLVIMAISV